MSGHPENAPAGALIADLLAVLDELFGLHPGFRPAHAKGATCSGTFTPAPEAAALTRAPHANRPSTPVLVRFSDSTGVPTIPDNSPDAGPRGMAVRFHLADHVHTDIVAHSHNGFPVRTGEEFLEMLRAVAAMKQGRPEAIGAFLASHPNAKRFVEAPKPTPSSFARESYFAMNAFKFTNAAGQSRFGRFVLRPAAGDDFLADADAAKLPPNFLFDELDTRLKNGSVAFNVSVRLPADGDDVNDASVSWPEGRTEVPFGTVRLTARADDADPEVRKVIYDPVPRVDGIDATDDPLIEVRAAIYLLSGRRRRAAGRAS